MYIHNTEVYNVSGAPSVFGGGGGAQEQWYPGHPLHPTLINPRRPGDPPNHLIDKCLPKVIRGSGWLDYVGVGGGGWCDVVVAVHGCICICTTQIHQGSPMPSNVRSDHA